MEVTTKELRVQPGKIIEHVVLGEEVTVTFRGRPLARIVPIDNKNADQEIESIFGMWKNHEKGSTVEEQVRLLREGRKF